jgi:hypothetical protein
LEAYELGREIVDYADQITGEPQLCSMLVAAAGALPVRLVVACIDTKDSFEVKRLFLQAMSICQLMETLLFILTLKGHANLDITGDMLKRCAYVQCDMLAFLKEQGS